MEIRKNFLVQAKPATVWTFFTDPTWIAACLPGAELTGQVDAQTYGGQITVKVGPVTSTYKGKVTFERLDENTRTAQIVAVGQDVKGKGGADMRINSQLVERGPGQTEVQIVSEVNVNGILAQMGRGMIQEVSDHMFQEFTSAMSASLRLVDPKHVSSPPTVASSGPLQVMSVGALVRHPLTWIVLLAAAGAVWFLFLR